MKSLNHTLYGRGIVRLLLCTFLSLIFLLSSHFSAHADQYEAEGATYSACSVKEHAEASSGFYLDGNPGFNVTWNIDHIGGNVNLLFGIKVPNQTRSMGVFLNNVQIGVISTSSTTWENVSIAANLPVGPNVIELRDSEGTAEPDIDCLRIIYSTSFEAEDSVYSNSILKADTNASGGSYLDGAEGFQMTWQVPHLGGDTQLAFNMKVPNLTRSMGVLVNGTKVGVITSSSTSWEIVTVDATLLDGINTVQLIDSEGTSEPDIDSLQLNNYIQAEDMALQNFSSQPSAAASGGQMIQLTAESGSASSDLSITEVGYYDITTTYFDESDGDATYKLFIDGTLIDAWSANRKLGSASPESTTLTDRHTKQVYLAPGQHIELLAYQDVGEFCRVDRLLVTKSVDEPTQHAMLWNADGTVASLLLNGVEHLSDQTGQATLRVFNGDDIRSWDMVDANTQSNIVEVVDPIQGFAKMYFRVDAYDHHLLLKLIAVEQMPKINSINIRLVLPIASEFNVLALDENAQASLSASELQLDWTRLGERSHYPGGVFALYPNGTSAENAAALAEIEKLHANAPVANSLDLTTDQGTAVAVTLSGYDGDGANLNYTVQTQPSHGALSGSAPNLVYTPDNGFLGTDTFTYMVNDGVTDSDSALVSISVEQNINGLVADWSMDDGSGTSVSDSENQFHASNSNTTWVSGIDNGAIEMSSVSSTINLPAEPFSYIDDTITIAMWAYGSDALPKNNAVFSATDSAGNRLLNIHLPWGNGDVYWDAGNDGSSYDRIVKSATPAEYKGQWNHWVFTKNASTGSMKIYLNGALWHSGSNTTRSMANITSATLGNQTAGSLAYDGMFDAVKLYNVELTASEVLDLTYSYTTTQGVPKVWLASQGIEPSDAGALADTDGDGLTNWQEYQAGSNPLVSDNPPGIRVTEYYLTTGDFSGTSTTLSLDQNLAENYFILIRGSHDGNGLSMPNNDYARVTGVPQAFGGMAESGAADQIVLERSAADTDWEGVVTVVECTNTTSPSGFKLVDILTTQLSGVSGTATSANWNDIDQVVLFGGYRGGGATYVNAPTNRYHGTSVYTRLWPSGSGTLNWTRDTGGETLFDAEMTTFVIEWGTDWDVQHVNLAGSNGGNGADASSEYATASINPVNRDNTWVWATGVRADAGIGDSAESCLVTLGDGVNQNATESTVAISSEYTDAYDFDVYTMTHTALAVDHQFKADGDSGSSDTAVSVDTATSGARFGWSYNGCNGTGSYFPRPRMWARYTADGEITISRGFSGQNFPAWVQGIDFSNLNN